MIGLIDGLRLVAGLILAIAAGAIVLCAGMVVLRGVIWFSQLVLS